MTLGANGAHLVPAYALLTRTFVEPNTAYAFNIPTQVRALSGLQAEAVGPKIKHASGRRCLRLRLHLHHNGYVKCLNATIVFNNSQTIGGALAGANLAHLVAGDAKLGVAVPQINAFDVIYIPAQGRALSGLNQN